MLPKAMGIVRGFLRRLLWLFRTRGYNYVLVHREATPLGPPWVEWVLAKLLRKKVVFDFDDAIWLPNTSANNSIAAGLKWHRKTGAICRWSHRVSAGNAYLVEYAQSQGAKNVQLNPTTIDTENLHNTVKNQQGQPLVIGWTGTHSTMKYLDFLVPIISRLQAKYSFEFHVISNVAPNYELASLKYVPWNKATEIADLGRFHIGVMPLAMINGPKASAALKPYNTWHWEYLP